MYYVSKDVLYDTLVKLNNRKVMEPGENPGRTGHCECGAFFINVIGIITEKTKRRDDAKSGYLLCGECLPEGA